MLRIQTVAIRNCRECVPLIERIKLHDSNLADQLRRAVTAVPLHVAEASGVGGGSRRLRHRTAMGEQAEAITAIEVAAAMGYLDAVDAKLLDRMQHIMAVLTKLTR